jgi:uncharacterized protein
METIIEKTTAYVKDYMSHYDASHDFAHVQRVLTLAKSIEASERTNDPDLASDSDTVTLAALLHDVGDKKYLKAGQDASTLVQTFLGSINCPLETAAKVQLICSNVSYSNELKNGPEVARLCDEVPELKIVQDADRLDALGAVGIARMYCFTGAKLPERGLDVSHFHEKLLRLEKMMRTETGRKMARERTRRMEVFLEWWGDEVGVDGTEVVRGK